VGFVDVPEWLPTGRAGASGSDTRFTISDCLDCSTHGLCHSQINIAGPAWSRPPDIAMSAGQPPSLIVLSLPIYDFQIAVVGYRADSTDQPPALPSQQEIIHPITLLPSAPFPSTDLRQLLWSMQRPRISFARNSVPHLPTSPPFIPTCIYTLAWCVAFVSL
jgi:hypothetical protein